MAKESIKARERKRAKMVAKYAAKRAALKEIVRTGTPEEVEQAVEKFDEVTKNLEEKVAEIGNLEPQKVESAAKETLNEIREMEEELRKEIEAEEEALTPNQRKGMRRWLGDFWNGVSSGWDN